MVGRTQVNKATPRWVQLGLQMDLQLRWQSWQNLWLQLGWRLRHRLWPERGSQLESLLYVQLKVATAASGRQGELE